MARPTPNENGYYRILWPERKLVSPGTLIMWASDDVNNAHGTEDYRVADINEALDVLLDTGSVTFARSA